MFFSLLYLAVRALLGLLIRSSRGPDAKDIELMVLRHELEVLRRQTGRPKLRPADRLGRNVGGSRDFLVRESLRPTALSSTATSIYATSKRS